MRQCPSCSAIYEDSAESCLVDGATLLKSDPLLGETFGGKYAVEALIGSGGMGAIYRARHLGLERTVALKIVRPSLGSHLATLGRFRREGVAIARLKHPNIIQVFDAGVVDGLGAYLVMEHLEGRSLRQVLVAEKRLSTFDALEIASQACAALNVAHEAGVIHRDIKPENIFLEDVDRGVAVKVLDFGIAKLTADSAVEECELTEQGEMVGSPAYMSPEQCEGLPLDARADIYSLGCVLYEMVTGKPPFSASSLPSLLVKHISDPPAPPSRHGVDVPASLEAAIERALEKRPENRFQTALDFAAALAEVGTAGEFPTRQHMSRPTVPTAARFPNNLPHATAKFIGREDLLADLATRMASPDARLVTIAGPGGAGKSRLALEAARGLTLSCPHGLWLVQLASLQGPELLAGAVASVLNIRQEADRPAADSLVCALRNRRMLIVLDNCEHVIDAAAELVTRLLAECPDVRLLVTSREALRVDGEQVVALQGMALPGAAAEAVDCDAVRLFAERAALARPGFSVDRRNATQVLEICRRLDGLPLAIELAAARVKVLSLEQITSRLDDRFALLTGTTRRVLPRMQTLRETVDWSYALLDDDEQALFRRISVFAGDWRLEDAEALWPARREDVMDLLSRLIDKSLVCVEEEDGEFSYRLLETLRAYAREKLALAPEEAEAARCHLDWCMARVAEVPRESRGGPAALRQTAARHDDYRAALRWCVMGVGDAGLAVPLVARLWCFWHAAGYWVEGLEWIEQAVSLPGADAIPELAEALHGAGDLAYDLGDFARSRELLEASLAVRTAADVRGAARTLQRLGDVCQCLGEFEVAAAHLHRSQQMFADLHDAHGIALATIGLGVLAMDAGDYRAAEAWMSQSLEVCREVGYSRMECAAVHNLGEIAQRRGDLLRAEDLLTQSLLLAEELGDQRMVAYSHLVLGSVARDRHHLDKAWRHLRKALLLFKQLGDRAGQVLTLEGIGRAAVDAGRAVEALTLFGASQRQREVTGVQLAPSERVAIERVLAEAAGLVSEKLARSAFDAGGRHLLDDAVNYAIELTGPGSVRRTDGLGA